MNIGKAIVYLEHIKPDDFNLDEQQTWNRLKAIQCLIQQVISQQEVIEKIAYKIENYTLLVGKNNIQNDYLTTKLAKSTDIWFHTKEIHGSHAILQTHGETPSIDVIISPFSIPLESAGLFLVI